VSLKLKRDQREFLAGALRDAAAGKAPELAQLLAAQGFTPTAAPSAPASDLRWTSWQKLSVAAGLLSRDPAKPVSNRELQRWCEGAARAPVLPHERRGNLYFVRPDQAWQHLRRHAGPRLQNLLRDAAPDAAALALPDLQGPDDLPHFLRQLLTPEVLKGLGAEGIRSANQSISNFIRATALNERRAGLLTADEAARLLDNCGQQLCLHVHDLGARKLAEKILALILDPACRACWSADGSRRAEALAVLEREIRLEVNAWLAAFQAEREKAKQGLCLLEGTA
jgi:hypothetical protein